MYNSVYSFFKAPYNVICYSDRTRLKTAVELLNATKYIESQLEKVSIAHSPMLCEAC